MTTQILLNTIKYRYGIRKSGSLVDDVGEDTTLITNSGGLLVTTNATLLAVAEVVRGMWANGIPQEVCDNTMLAAFQVTHDTVGNTVSDEATRTTGLTVNSGTTGATVNGQTLTHALTFSKCLPAAGTTVHAQVAAGAPVNISTLFTNPLPRRTLTITRSNAGVAGTVDYTCTYITPSNTTTTTTVSVPKGAAATTLVAGEWTAVTTTVDPGSTSDFTTGVGFCVGEVLTATTTPVLSCNGIVEAPASYDLASGTITTSTAPDGTREFCVYFQNSHNHGITDAGHAHGVTDAGHAHTHNAHTHALS